LSLLKSRLAVTGQIDNVSFLRQRLPQALTNYLVVLNHQNAQFKAIIRRAKP
jgi:hypothetical protein